MKREIKRDMTLPIHSVDLRMVATNIIRQLFRGDLIPKDDVLFLNVEKVTIKKTSTCLNNVRIVCTEDIEELEVTNEIGNLKCSNQHV